MGRRLIAQKTEPDMGEFAGQSEDVRVHNRARWIPAAPAVVEEPFNAITFKAPKTYTHLGRDGYTFEVRALSAAGSDPTPATKKFQI